MYEHLLGKQRARHPPPPTPPLYSPFRHNRKTSVFHCKGSRRSAGTFCRPRTTQPARCVARGGAPVLWERNLEMKFDLRGCDCPLHGAHLIPSSELRNHEVNQRDTRTSISQTPIGLTWKLAQKKVGKKGSGYLRYMYFPPQYIYHFSVLFNLQGFHIVFSD